MAVEIKAGPRNGSRGGDTTDLQGYLRKYGYLGAAAAAERFGMRSFPGAKGQSRSLMPSQGAGAVAGSCVVVQRVHDQGRRVGRGRPRHEHCCPAT